MKDSARRLFDVGVAIALATAVLATASCGRKDKATDIAQDSILVRDADLTAPRTDTSSIPPATLVRERGSAADVPVLTRGAPVKRAPTVTTGANSGLRPPTRVNPSPVLPGRDTSSTGPAIQPPTLPTRDSTRDSIVVVRFSPR